MAARISKRWIKLFGAIPKYDPIASARPGDWFSEETADDAVAFVEECLTHIEGALAGQPFLLEPWQKAAVGCIFGWKALNGFRRYREVFFYVPRKNGKTPLAAAIANCSLFTDHEIGAQNICAAGEREQATLLFRQCKGQIENEDELADRAKIYSGQGQRAIFYEAESSGLKVVSSDAGTKHGGNGHLAIIDELHVQPNRDLVDVIETSMASANRMQPLLIHLTTADVERESICNEKHDFAQRVRDGDILDPQFLPVVFEATKEEVEKEYKTPDGDRCGWEMPEVWAKANPNLGVSVSPEYMERAARKARNVPGYLNTFLRMHLNVRTDAKSRWLPMEMWDKGGADDPIAWRADALERLRGRECVGGLDLGSISDLTALALLFEIDGGGFEWLPWFWVPAEGVQKKDRAHRSLYETWIRQGFITVTPGNVTDYHHVLADIVRLGIRFRIADLGVDRLFQGVQVCTDLMSEGFEVTGFGQGFYGMAAPCKAFEELILGGKLIHGSNPVLRWMASNVEVVTDPAGNMKPTKPQRKSQFKIDGIVGGLMALGRAMVRKEETESAYADGKCTSF